MGSDRKESKPKRRSNNAYRAVGDDGGLVVVPSDSEVQVLNPVASKIYSMLDGKHTRSEILRAIVDEFDVTEDTAGRDLDEFLADLASRRLVEDGEGETPQAEPA